MSACPTCRQPAQHIRLVVPMGAPELPIVVEHLCRNDCPEDYFDELARDPRAILEAAILERENPVAVDEARRALHSLPLPRQAPGVLDAVAALRALADHRERMPECLCRQDDVAGKTPRTAEDHVAHCHERSMVERLRAAADGAEQEHRLLVAHVQGACLGSRAA